MWSMAGIAPVGIAPNRRSQARTSNCGGCKDLKQYPPQAICSRVLVVLHP